MIKRILVGLGGTPFTSTAIRYAVELAQVQQAEILGMTVIDRRRLAALTKASGTAQDAVHEMNRLGATQKAQEQAIAAFESACANSGIRYTVAQESGDPFETMISQARYHDLMIFGLRSLFDYDVVDTAPTDVLTRLVSRGVRPILAVSQEYRPIRRACWHTAARWSRPKRSDVSCKCNCGRNSQSKSSRLSTRRKSRMDC
jgi:nucleotide-binding universal stress UspA family protein